MEFDTNKAKYPWSLNKNVSVIKDKIPVVF